MIQKLVSVLVLVVAGCPGLVSALHVGVETKPYPIDRLIRNLEVQAAEKPGDWDTAKRLARLHGMVYALKIDSIEVDTNMPKGTSLDGREHYSHDEWALPHRPVVEAKDDTQRRIAKEHLEQAIYWYEKALAIAPEHPLALLGYGWCLMEAGRKAEAKDAFRTIVDNTLRDEQLRREGRRVLLNRGWGLEAAHYLLELLDPEREAREYQLREEQRAHFEKYRSDFITPVVIPLESGLTPEDMLDPEARVGFDLSSTGRSQCWTWIHPNAAWLVHDYHKRGRIKSSRDLFGDRTFNLFWNNGFEPMAALDDNRDGRLHGSELVGLGLWRDVDNNGVCESNELQTVQDAGIVSLRYDYSETTVNGQVMWAVDMGVEFANGETRTIYDLVLRAPPIEVVERAR